MKYIPYTYLIGWSKLDRWYYGSETGQKTKTANPLNLWTTYFTSSKVIDEFRLQHGEPDIIKVRRIFTDRKAALEWETKLLSKLDAARNDRWLNEHNGGTNFAPRVFHTEETRRKMSESGKKKVFTSEHRANLSKSGKGRKKSDATRELNENDK